MSKTIVDNLELMNGNIVSLPLDDDIYIVDNYDIGSLSFVPILITEDWVKKFGFKKQLDGRYTKGSCLIEIFFYKEGCSVFSNSSLLNHIKNIHQLQNLYLLLRGEVLKINM